MKTLNERVYLKTLLIQSTDMEAKETNMARYYNQNQSPLLKIVYSKIIVKGKIELVPLELYADGSLKRG